MRIWEVLVLKQTGVRIAFSQFMITKPRSISIVSLLLLTAMTNQAWSTQCRQIFLTDAVIPAAVKSALKADTRVVYSPNKSLIWIQKPNDNRVTHAVSGKTISTSSEKPIFSSDSDTFAILDRDSKQIYLYSGSQMTRTAFKTPINHIVDIRGGLIIGQKKNTEGFFILDIKTGFSLHHVEHAEVFLKETQSGYLTFITYPKINGFRRGQGLIESIAVEHIKTGLVVSESLVFDRHDENYIGDFIKIKKKETSSEWTFVRKTDLFEIALPHDFIETYAIEDLDKESFVVRSATRLQIYQGRELVLNKAIQASNRTKFIGFSKSSGAFVGYDLYLNAFVLMMAFGKSDVHVAIGPKGDFHNYAPKLLQNGSILYKNQHGEHKVWLPSDTPIN